MPVDIEQLLRDAEARLTMQIRDVKNDLADVKEDVKAASDAADAANKLSEGARWVAKGLAYVLGIIVAVATIYGVFHG